MFLASPCGGCARGGRSLRPRVLTAAGLTPCPAWCRLQAQALGGLEGACPGSSRLCPCAHRLPSSCGRQLAQRRGPGPGGAARVLAAGSLPGPHVTAAERELVPRLRITQPPPRSRQPGACTDLRPEQGGPPSPPCSPRSAAPREPRLSGSFDSFDRFMAVRGEDLAPPHSRLPEGTALWLQLLKTKRKETNTPFVLGIGSCADDPEARF